MICRKTWRFSRFEKTRVWTTEEGDGVLLLAKRGPGWTGPQIIELYPRSSEK